MKVNWNLVVDVVVALVGVYVLMNGIWMKSTGKTSSLLATPEELKKCKHPEKIREEVTPKMLLCGALALVFGIVTALGESIFKLPIIIKSGILLLLVLSCLFLVSTLKNAREKYL